MVASNLQGAGLLADPEAAQTSFPEVSRPLCERFPASATQLTLESQSVPSASQLPCLASLPLGWTFHALEAQSGSSRLVLNSDRAGVEAADVTLTRGCDVDGATRVPTDEPGTERYERIENLANRYTGSRYYRFDGGCATFRFDFSGEGRTSLAEEVSLAISFHSRADLMEKLERDFGLDL
jgi:hypothetical protein